MLGLNNMFKSTLLIFAFVLAFSCCDRRAWLTEDEWYNAPKDRSEYFNSNKILGFHVKVNMLDKAILELKDKEYKMIELDEVNLYTSEKMPNNINGEYYLVRAVKLQDNSRLIICQKGNSILVHHGCLGKNPRIMKKSVVVVYLSTEPNKIYSTCSMAE